MPSVASHAKQANEYQPAIQYMSDAVLAKLDKCRVYLAECTKAEEAKEIADVAEAARVYAKRKGAGIEVYNKASEYRLRAERKLGEILATTPKAEGGRPLKTGSKTEPVSTLAEMGIDKKTSSRAQALAAVPDEDFEAMVQVTGEQELNASQVAKDAQKRKRRENQTAAEESRAKEFVKEFTLTDDERETQCDALITDPPYGILDEEWEPGELAMFTRNWAAQWNDCGAKCAVIFWSQRYLWEGRRWFDEELSNYEFQQLLIWHYPNNKSPQSRKGFKQTWEPAFFYRAKDSDFQVRVGGGEWGEELNDFDCHVAAVPQSNFNGENTKIHPAQKPVSAMKWLINAVTDPGDLVCDPFTGSGTTGIAALQLGRNFYGIETNEEYREEAERRIKAYG